MSRRGTGPSGARRAGRTALAIVLACVAIAATARAQTGLYFDEFGGDARSAAMGQAFTGLADTAAAAYYNPGGVGFAPAQTSLGFRYTNPELRIEFRGEPPEDVSTDAPSTQGMVISVLSDLDHPGLNKRFPWLEPLALGVEVFLPLPQVNSFSTFTSTAQAYFFRYDTRPDVLSLVFSLAYRITDWFSIGAGFMPNFDSLQDNHANVRLNAPEGDPTMGTDLELEQEATGTFTPLFGILLKAPNEGLRDVISLGFSYRGRVKNYFGTGRSDQSVGLGLPDLSFFQLVYIRGELVNFVGFVPEQYSAGLGLHPMERLTLGLDVTYKRWEDFTFWLDQPPNPRFQNTLVPRIGGEYAIPIGGDILGVGHFTYCRVRGGYYYEPSANPTLSGRQNIIDNDQHVASIGIGLDTILMNKYSINYDILFQAHVFNHRRTKNVYDPLFPPFVSEGEVYTTGFDVNFGW